MVVGLILLIAGCTGGDADLLLLPVDGGDLEPVSASVLVDALGDMAPDLVDVRSATAIAAVPGASEDSCRTDAWTAPPTDAPAVALPGIGYTLVRTGPTDDGTATVVCDFDADGDLLVTDDLSTTGTDQSVGNDYAQRVGRISGRVDVGIPTDAVLAVQTFATWSLLVPLDPEMAVLRLHALQGGSAADGYDVGTITFLDAQGTDVTAASLPIPDVVHGVPRNRGSSVTPRD